MQFAVRRETRSRSGVFAAPEVQCPGGANRLFCNGSLRVAAHATPGEAMGPAMRDQRELTLNRMPAEPQRSSFDPIMLRSNVAGRTCTG